MSEGKKALHGSVDHHWERVSVSDRENLQAILGATESGRRVTFVSGVFNVVHSGHIRLLNFGAECGDCLVVGVLPDGTPGASVPEDLRLEAVQSISVVDHAFVLGGPVADVIAALQPSFVVKGKEHEGRRNAEQAAVDNYGGTLLFGSDDTRFSSAELLRTEVDRFSLGTIEIPTDYPDRHGFSVRTLERILDRMRDLSVVVVGDLIVDEYVACEPLGMSQEDPTLVVTPIAKDRFVGGAGIVASHAAGLGAKASLVSVAGDDDAYQFASEKLSEHGVAHTLIEDVTRPTTVKTRYRARDKTLLRVNQLRQHDISTDLVDGFHAAVCEALPAADLLVFADFNYGCLPQKLVDRLCGYCREQSVMMVADSQASSQYSDISRFRDMSLVTPTEREARLAVRDFASGLVEVASKLQSASGARNVLMTLGSEGILVQTQPDPVGDAIKTDRLPAMNTAPRDVAGAGDSLLVTASMAMAVGASIWEAGFLGSLAAACQVAHLGNRPLQVSEIIEEINL